MSEPSKEELLARIAELEKQAGSRKKGSLGISCGRKRRSECVWTGAISSHAVLRAVDPAAGYRGGHCARFGREQEQAEIEDGGVGREKKGTVTHSSFFSCGNRFQQISQGLEPIARDKGEWAKL